MKSTELFVEQTLTGFLVLSAAAAPFISIETLPKLTEDAKGGVDIGSAAGAIGAAYLLGVVFDRFADTLLERLNRWNRLLFAIDLMKDGEALEPGDPFPEDRLQIEMIKQGDEAWEWMDYLRSRIRIARAMTAFVPALTLSLMIAVGLRDRASEINTALTIMVGAYLASFLASRILERSKSQRLPKTYELEDGEDCDRACKQMSTAREPVAWLAAVLMALGLGLIAIGNDPGRGTMTAIFAAGIAVTGISGWTWWRMTMTFMQFLYDYRKWGADKAPKKS
jgi:hypothetical protein